MADVDIDAPVEESAVGHPLVRYCIACGEAVTIRWTAHGDPVFWTCPDHGIRDSHETETITPEDYAETTPQERVDRARQEVRAR